MVDGPESPQPKANDPESWTAESTLDGEYKIVARGWAFATLHYDYRHTYNAETFVRAHLIAAAPDLYAVCREFIDALGPDGYHPVPGKGATDRMRAALAKAQP